MQSQKKVLRCSELLKLKQKSGDLREKHLKLVQTRLQHFIDSIVCLEDMNKSLMNEIGELKQERGHEAGEQDTEKHLLNEVKYLESRVSSLKSQLAELDRDLKVSYKKVDSLAKTNEELRVEKESLKSSIRTVNKNIASINQEVKTLLEHLYEINKRSEFETSKNKELCASIESLEMDITFQLMIREQVFKLGNQSFSPTVNLESSRECIKSWISLIREKLKDKQNQNRKEMSEMYAQKLKSVLDEMAKERDQDQLVVLNQAYISISDQLEKEKSLNQLLKTRFQTLSVRFNSVSGEKQKVVDEYNCIIAYLNYCLIDQLEIFFFEKAYLKAEGLFYLEMLNQGDEAARLETLGHVGIKEIDSEFRSLIIENKSDANEYDLSDWYLKQAVARKRRSQSGYQVYKTLLYVIPVSVLIKPGHNLVIKSSSESYEDSLTELRCTQSLLAPIEWNDENYTSPMIVMTQLFDSNARLRSTLIQKILS